MAKKQRVRSAYAEAGVDIDEKMDGLDRIKRMVRGTRTRGVMSDIGSFGGLFQSPGQDAVLVASTDGVGTKLKVAVMAGRHTTVGQDLVNHCVNDILVQGAEPLFFMDYIGTAKLNADVFEAVVSGLCKACRENGCALLGGETAEMPGLYPEGEYDLVGTIVGVAPRSGLITGKGVRPGDVLIGLPSTGLHTNGYSLARKAIFERAGLTVGDTLPGSGRSVADVLLAVHRSYLKPVKALMRALPVRALAHITGGGFPDNIPRVLPEGSAVVVDTRAWTVPPVYRFIQEQGRVETEEMYRVFNMGIGMIVMVREGDAGKAMALLKRLRTGARAIGKVVRGAGTVTLTA